MQEPRTCSKLEKNEDYGRTLRDLGEGGYGKVVLKDGGQYGIPVAVKQFPLLDYEGGIKQSFVRETSILLTLDHPNIVRLLDIIIEDEEHITSKNVKISDMADPVASLVEEEKGKSLYGSIYKEVDFKPLLMQLLSALDYIHSLGIYHRDIKPGNILVNKDNHLTLIDFGISRQTTIEDADYTYPVFTVGYRPPEVLQEKRYTAKSDIWAAGMIWIQILLGNDKFIRLVKQNEKKQKVETIEQLVKILHERPEEIVPSLSRPGLLLLKKMLTLNPNQRYSAREALDDPYFKRREIKASKDNLVGFDWKVNSCYIDSLLMVMFTADTEFFRDGILGFDPYSVKYESSFCETKAKEIVDIPAFVKEIQEQIRHDLSQIHSGVTKHSCSRLRSLLAACLPSMKTGKDWGFFSVRELYSAFVSMFPRLQMLAPTQKMADGKPVEPVIDQLFKIFTMWDYMDAHTNIEDKYIKILWDRIETPMLVFTNSLAPRITEFNKLGIEKGVHRINDKKIPWKAEKGRKFGETIIGGKYELVGVITITGVKKGGEGGSHYVCYFKTADGNWNYYNDMKNYAIAITKLPKVGVWTEDEGYVPEMYFYRKIRGAINPLDYPRYQLSELEGLELRSFRTKNPKVADLDIVRSRQIDYLKQDCEALEIARITFFLAVKILDLFIYQKPQRFLDTPNTVVVACLNLAVKFYEVNSVTYEQYEEQSDKKVVKKKIIDCELEIYRELCQNVNFSTCYDYFLYYKGSKDNLPILYTLLRTELVYAKSDLQLGKMVASGKLDKEIDSLYQENFVPEIDNILLETNFTPYSH